MTKYLYLLLVFLCLPVSAICAQPDTLEYYMDYSKRKLEKHEGGEYYFRRQYKSGNRWYVKDYFVEQRRLYCSAAYSDDSLKVREGVVTKYHPNGNLKSKMRYVAGAREGLYREYDTTAKLIDSAYYLHDIPVNTHYSWYRDGKLKFKGVYDKEGKGTGEEWQYWENGNPDFHGWRSEGYLKDSLWTYYHENGNISYKEYNEKGVHVKGECYDIEGVFQPGTCDTAKMPEATVNVPNYLGNTIRFPQEALEAISARTDVYSCTVIVEFVVEKDGSITVTDAYNRCHPALINEAKYLVSHMPKWNPGILYNRPVRVWYTLPIVFRIEE